MPERDRNDSELEADDAGGLTIIAWLAPALLASVLLVGGVRLDDFVAG